MSLGFGRSSRGACLLAILLALACSYSSAANPLAIYILEIDTNIRGDFALAAPSMTLALEAAFSRKGTVFQVLDRRHLDLIVKENQLEKDLQAITHGEPASIPFARLVHADGFVRGELKDGADGVVLTVTLTKLDSAILWQGSAKHTKAEWQLHQVQELEAERLATDAAGLIEPTRQASPQVTQPTAPSGPSTTELTGGKVLMTVGGAALPMVAWSPDGHRLLMCGARSLRILDSDSGRELLAVPYDGYVSSINWSPDGNRLAAVVKETLGKRDHYSVATTMWIVDSIAGTKLQTLKLKNDGRSVDDKRLTAWSPDGTRFAITVGKTLTIVDAHDGRELSSLPEQGADFSSLSWSPDGGLLATANDDYTASIFDLRSGRLSLYLMLDRDPYSYRPFMSTAWEPDGKRLATGVQRNRLKIWDVTTGKALLTLKDYGSTVAWNPDGRRLAVAGTDNAVRVWDAETGKQLTVLFFPVDPELIAESRVISRSIGGGNDVTGSFVAPTVNSIETDHGAYKAALAWSPEGKRLAMAAFGKVIIWDVGSFK